MPRTRCRLTLFGLLALALSLTVGMASGSVAAAKKKKSTGGGTVDITKVVGAQVPADTATTNGLLTSTLDVAATKQFRGTRIRDVNLTLTTVGSTAAAPGSANDLAAKVTAPDGTTVWLFRGTLQGQSIGPLTLDDETPVSLGGLPPAPDAFTLVSPYVGTAQPFCWPTRGPCAFSAMDNRPVTGPWTLRVYDLATPASTSILANWRLVVQAGRPYKTK